MSITTAQIRSPNAVPNTTSALSAELARRAAVRSTINPQQALTEQLRREAASARLSNTLAQSRQAQLDFQRSIPPRTGVRGTGQTAQNINSFLSNSQSARVPPQTVVNNAYTPGATYNPRVPGANSIAARNAAAAAGGTLAQANAAARAAASPATLSRALQASPMIGAGLAGVITAGGVKANGGSLAETLFSGVGAAVGSTLGLGGGVAVATGSLGTGNPFIAAAAPLAGQAGGAAAGGAAGFQAGKVYDLLPMPVKKGLLGGLGALLPGFGALSPLASPFARRFLQPENVAGGAVASPTEMVDGPASFTGGQSIGVRYRVTYQFHNIRTDGVTLYPPTVGTAGGSVGYPGPISGLRGQGQPDYQSMVLEFGDGLEEPVRSGNCAQGCFRDFSILSVARVDGQPDTGGGLAPPQVPQPATRPRPYNPLEALPPLASPETAPPPTAPAPNNAPSQAPTVRPSAPPATAPAAPNPGPALPAGDPLADPAPTTNPTANPDPTAPPQADPTNVPGKTPGQKTDRIQPALKPGETITLPSGTTVTGTENGYRITSPIDSPNTIKLPTPQTLLSPGETATVDRLDPPLWPLLAIPVLAVSALLTKATTTTGKIGDPTTPGQFTAAPPQTPQAAKPSPPNTGCRCNGPILAGQSAQTAELAGIKTQLARIETNQTGPQGFAGIYAFLVEMRSKLGAVGDFAETAWRATKMQKVLDLLTFVGVMHNVSMLSRDIGETFFYVVGQGLDIVGIDDEEGNQLDVQQIVSTTVYGYLTGIFGEAFVEGARANYLKANRIVQSASMIIWTVRSIQDAGLDLMEWIGENTGKIGNALKRFGVVGDRSYPWMAESAQARAKGRARFSKLTDTLENVEDRVSSYSIATSNVIEIQQETQELGENWTAFKTSLDDLPDPWGDNTPVQAAVATETAASVSPNITAADADNAN